MPDDADIRAVSQALVADLVASGKTLTTAESCTGGWIAKAVTDIPGGSAVFGFGVVSYSNRAKESLLGVANATLEEHGAVSEATVREMAEGAVNLSGADLGLAVSGIAGPDGGSADKPVGTVWFAWSIRDGNRLETTAERQCFPGERDAVRKASVLHALRGIHGRLSR